MERYAVVLLLAIPTVAQSCVSLASSTQCAAFNASSVSTDSRLTGLFSFLSNVTDTASFDSSLEEYIATTYTQRQYQDLFGCSTFDSSKVPDYYARYTTSVICNAVIQNSIKDCGLTGDATRALCADTCSQFALSEQSITATDLCGTVGPNAQSQLRADLTNCGLPGNAISTSCIEGSTNEPDNCGYSDNLISLCAYCAASSPNATDSCCVFSNTETRCSGVVLPVQATSSLPPIMSSTSTASPTSTSTSTAHSGGLTGGQIAGIVVGSVLGAFVLLALLIAACVFFRRRSHSSPASSIFNQPGQARQGPPMIMHDGANNSQRDHIEAVPGGRVTRMSAIEGDEQKYGWEETPRQLPKRSGSLTSGSVLAVGNESPSEDLSSPEGTGQSEQLESFKDYYSQDEIRPGDLVSTLWAYQPRAHDEFELERGDMLKVTGIWDDGWATGIRVRMHAEDWRDGAQLQRDSGMSNSGGSSPTSEGQVKAFPLVCICLPQHWRKTIEGDSTGGPDL